MDYPTLRQTIAQKLGLTHSEIDALVEGLGIALCRNCAELDSTAVPTFGTFAPQKHPEEIITDLSTGRKMLVPPEITIEFRPAAMLTKRLR